jgi:hypothetical protein
MLAYPMMPEELVKSKIYELRGVDENSLKNYASAGFISNEQPHILNCSLGALAPPACTPRKPSS